MKRLNLLFLLFLCPMLMFGQTANTAYGTNALYYNTTGSYNSAFGYEALLGNSTGSYNSAVGYQALGASWSGLANTAFGYQALLFNSTGNSNTAFGYRALFQNNTNHNTAVGYQALQATSSGSGNTAIGAYTLTPNTVGFMNTAIGSYAGYLNANNLNSSTAIGDYAQNTQSNEVMLGSTFVGTIGGYAGWTTFPSDRRAKKNVHADVPGLAFINLLQPVTYNIDLDAVDEMLKSKSDDPEINRLRDSILLARSPEEIEIIAKARADKEKQVYSGFIAQDVEKAAQSVGYDFSGVDAPENDKTPYGLRYAEFVAPLVKAVQELSEQNNRLQEQINELTAKLNELANVPKILDLGGVNGGEAAANFSFSLFPNPTRSFVTVDYSLFVDAPILIELYNSFGQRVKLIVPNQNQRAGQYSVQTSVGDLVSGTYIVRAVSGNQVESKQLVIN